MRREGEELFRAVRVALLPNSKKSYAMDFFGEIKRMASYTLEVQCDVAMDENFDDETRLRMLGSNIKLGGGIYLQKHPVHLSWLREKGWTAEFAVAQYDSWMEDVNSRVNWAPIRNGNDSNIRRRLDSYQRDRSVK
jgi:hypothetical protein